MRDPGGLPGRDFAGGATATISEIPETLERDVLRPPVAAARFLLASRSTF